MFSRAMTSLCRNKTPGLLDCTKNAAIEKVLIISSTDNTPIVCRTALKSAFHLYAAPFTAMKTKS